MEKKKYKDLDENEKWLHDAVGKKTLAVISLSAFFSIGIWMILVPEGMKHSSVERSTVYLMKEIWSFEAGLLILAITIPFIIKTILTINLMKGFVWVRQESGYYMFENKQRVSGLQSLYDGKDLIVFHPKKNEVYSFPNYTKTKKDKFKKVVFENRFNCMDGFWSAAEDGFYLYYKGVRAENLTSEYKGDDLIVTAGDLGRKFRLKNYKSNLDNRIRKAVRY
jgi:hypothetical protein